MGLLIIGTFAVHLGHHYYHVSETSVTEVRHILDNNNTKHQCTGDLELLT